MIKVYIIRVLKVLAALLFLYTFLGFVLLPYIIQSNFSKTVKSTTDANGYLEKVYINPYTFELELTNLLIQDKKNINLLYFKKFALDFEITSIFKDILVLQSINLTDLKTNIILDKEKKVNFQFILDFLNNNKVSKIDTKNTKTTPLLLVKINDIKFIDNRINFIDNSKSSPFEIKTKKFNIKVKNLSIAPNEEGKLSTIIDIKDTAYIRLDTNLSLNPLKFDGNFMLDNLRVNRIYNYIKDDVDFELNKGLINTYFKYKVEVKDDNLKASIDNIKTTANGVKFKNKDIDANLNSLINKIDKIKIQKDVEDLNINLNGKLAIKEIKLNRPYQDINGTKDFFININKINTNLAYKVDIKNDNLKVVVKDTNILLNNINYKNQDLKVNLPILINKIEKIKLEKDIGLLDVKLNGQLITKDIKLNRPYKDIKDFKLNVNKVNTTLAYNVEFNNDNLNVVIKDTNILSKNIKYENKDLKANLTTLTNKIKQIDIKKAKRKDIELIAKDIIIKNTNLIFNDLSKKTPIKLNIKNINAKADAVTLDKSIPIKFKLSLDTPHKGNIYTKGNIVIEPLKVNMKLKTKDIAFIPYIPYIKEFANVNFKSGSLSTDLNIKLKKEKDILAPYINGDISIDKLDIFHSLTHKRLFALKQFKIEDLKYKTDDLNIKNILLDSSYSKFIIAKDKTTNFDNIIANNSDNNDDNNDIKAKEDKSSDFKYFIKNVQLKNSKIDFADFSLPLNFSTKIHSLTANIEAISSEDINTKVSLTGMVDKYGSAKIEGKVNTANFKKKSDIAINFENLDLISASPYSGKFIGNKISKGKLWLDLNYKIKDSNLTSTNNIKIKNLELGDKIESNESIDLPIGLAIALLEDSNGFIDVEVPVQGDINNPEFKLSGAIWSAVGNILTNIITSPFRFLASLLGVNSDELSSIDFDHGAAVLLPQEIEKLDKLVMVLNKKPKISLLLNPIYDKINDIKALQKEKFLSLTNKKNKNDIIKNLFIKQFTEEKYKKIKGSSKDKDINDIYANLIIPTIVIDKITLEQLANNRANSIKTYLLSKKLDPIRIILANKIELSDKVDKKRVTMKLDIEIKKD